MQYRSEDWEGQDVDNIERLRQIKKDLTDIQVSAGKKYLDGLLRARYDAIMAGIAGAPLSGLDGALAQEYQKGQAYACLFLAELVPALMDDFDQRIKQLMFNQPEDNEDD